MTRREWMIFLFAFGCGLVGGSLTAFDPIRWPVYWTGAAVLLWAFWQHLKPGGTADS